MIANFSVYYRACPESWCHHLQYHWKTPMASGMCTTFFDSENKVQEVDVHPKRFPSMKSDCRKEVYLVAAYLDCLQEMAYIK